MQMEATSCICPALFLSYCSVVIWFQLIVTYAQSDTDMTKFAILNSCLVFNTLYIYGGQFYLYATLKSHTAGVRSGVCVPMLGCIMCPLQLLATISQIWGERDMHFPMRLQFLLLASLVCSQSFDVPHVQVEMSKTRIDAVSQIGRPGLRSRGFARPRDDTNPPVPLPAQTRRRRTRSCHSVDLLE